MMILVAFGINSKSYEVKDVALNLTSQIDVLRHGAFFTFSEDNEVEIAKLMISSKFRIRK